MFGMRRYRLFVLVATLAAVLVYYLGIQGSWTVADLERIGHETLNHNAPKHAPNDAPVEVLPHAPTSIPVDGTVDLVNLASAHTSSDVKPTTTRSSESYSSHASSTTPAIPNSSAEELLSPDVGDITEFGDEGSGRLDVEWTPRDGKSSRWQQPHEHFPLPIEKIIHLPANPALNLPKIQATFGRESLTAKQDRIRKLNTIKESFKHAWQGYKQYGFPHDEVKPITKTFADPFMGWGATLVDSLDTLWIMGLTSEFEAAVQHVAKIDFKTSLRKDIPLFETVIRYLGGLLAAYDVTDGKYPVLLVQAEGLAEILMGAFDTPNRMPITFYNWAPSYTSQPHRASSHTVMAELGSLALEMTRLAQITQNPKFYDAIARITNELERWQSHTLIPGLWPLKIDASGCKKAERTGLATDDETVSLPVLVDEAYDSNLDSRELATSNNYSPKADLLGNNFKRRGHEDYPADIRVSQTQPLQRIDQEILSVECNPQGLAAAPHNKPQTYGIGGQADSTYEYLPKMHIMLHGRTEQYRDMYEASVRAIREQLLFRPMIKDSTRKILFTAKVDLSPKAKLDKNKEIITHEVTHLSCFAGGMFGLGAKLFGLEDDLELAKQLTDGCVWAYESMPMGVMAESAALVACPSLEMCKWDQRKWYAALDPNQDDRIAAVKSWNQKQEEIYARSKSAALTEAAVDSKGDSDPESTGETGVSEKVRGVKARSVAREEPSRTVPRLEFEERDDGEETSGQVSFVPKIALSHDRFVKARIQEERLPPSYIEITDKHYGLRPEAIESVFYMYRLTGDESWRQKGWRMFEAIQSATQTEVANAGMKDVTSTLGELEDTMESFWLAETLKYFYLLFDEPDRWSLDEWVLNTEAHFFKVSQ